MNLLDFISKDIEGEETSKQTTIISSIDSYLTSLNTPNNFSISSDENVMLQMDLSFAKLCTSLEEAGIASPRLLSVFDFNVKINYFEEKNKKSGSLV